MLDNKRRNLLIIGVFLVISIATYLQYQNTIIYWDAIGLYVVPVEEVEEADVILLSEDVLSRYHRIAGVLSKVDKRGTVVLGFDRKDEMDEFFSLTEENSFDLEEDFVFLTLGGKHYRIFTGIYGGKDSQPIYLILAVVFGFITVTTSAIQVYFHFKKR